MECEYCHNMYDTKYGSGRFCSSVCAHRFGSRVNREIRNERIGRALKGRKYPFRIYHGKPRAHTQETKDKISLMCKKRWLNKIRTTPFENLSYDGMRAILLEEQHSVCASCGSAFIWLGKKLNPELHHKDGNKTNKARNNAELLCPNCHSLTKYFRFNGRVHKKETRLRIGETSSKAYRLHLGRPYKS